MAKLSWSLSCEQLVLMKQRVQTKNINLLALIFLELHFTHINVLFIPQMSAESNPLCVMLKRGEGEILPHFFAQCPLKTHVSFP